MYPKYQLLVYGWYSDGWWRETDPNRDLGCSQEEMNTALQHALAPIQAEFYTNKSLPTEGGLVCVSILPPNLMEVYYMCTHTNIILCTVATL